MQSKEVAQQQSTLEKQEAALSELRETGERLQRQLDEKDAHILRLNLRLEAKDAHISRLNERLEEIEGLIGRLGQRQEDMEAFLRAQDDRREQTDGETAALLSRLAEREQSAPAPLPQDLSARLDRFCDVAEALLAEGERRMAAAAAERAEQLTLKGEVYGAPASRVTKSPAPKQPTTTVFAPRSFLKKSGLASLLHPAPAARRQGQGS